jgi:hypothetical protein
MAAELRSAIDSHPSTMPFTLLLANDDSTFFEYAKARFCGHTV